MADDELRRLERAWQANRGDLAVLEQLVEQRLRLAVPVPGEERESRVLPAREFDSDSSFQVQALVKGRTKPIGVGKTPTGGKALSIPPHQVWWVLPAPPGGMQIERVRDEVIRSRIPGLSFEKKKVDDLALAKLAGLDLSALSLEKCPRVTDQGMAHVASLKQLAWLDLTRTGVTDAGIARLVELPQLFSLKVWKDDPFPRLTAKAADSLAACSNLMRLDVSGMPLGREGLDRLGALRGLRELTLGRSDLVGADLSALAAFEHLEVLTLMDGIDAEGLRHVAAARTLRELTLMSPVAAGLHHLCALPALEALTIIGGATITDEALDVLAMFPALERMNFGACPFDLANGLPGFPDLRRFDLAYRPPGGAVVDELERRIGVRVLPRPAARRPGRSR